jgi:hypothetical protein
VEENKLLGWRLDPAVAVGDCLLHFELIGSSSLAPSAGIQDTKVLRLVGAQSFSKRANEPPKTQPTMSHTCEIDLPK